MKYSSAADALKGFFCRMHHWDKHFYAQLRWLLESEASLTEATAVQDKAREVLAEIYAEFGVEGKKNRNRMDGLGLSDPPAYEAAPDIQDYTESGDHCAVYLVRKTSGLQGQYRYTVKKRDGRWRLTKREFFDHEQKWRSFAF